MQKCGDGSCDKEGKKRCMRCFSVWYCSKECQTANWSHHKKVCKPQTSSSQVKDLSSAALDLEKLRAASLALGDLSVQPKIPKFHNEYAAKYRDDRAGIMFLGMEYNLALLPGKGIDAEMAEYGTQQQVLMKRWAPVSGEPLWKMLESSVGKPGKICPLMDTAGIKRIRQRAILQACQVMRNTPVDIVDVEVGKTYATLGFADLQQIMFSNIVDPEKPGHVTWFGADVNSICVARAELILHLIRTEACSPKEILQIWYSSSISQEAMKALKRCCQILAKDETMKMKGLNQYFEFWGNVRVELSSEKARLQWLMESSAASREPITDMMKVIDRQSISRYFLTGEIFLGGGKNNQGNITTFLSPENALENRIEANIFSTINLRDIPEVEGSFVTAVETLFLTKLTSFQSHLKSYKIQINLSDGIIARDAATNDAMLTNIRTVTKPDVMYWSNLPEYWTRKEFFEIAKLCSTSETKHCFHLINWHQSVYGCNPIDYMVFDKQRAASIPFKDFNGNINISNSYHCIYLTSET